MENLRNHHVRHPSSRPDALIDHDLEGLISHELIQWFHGDLICNSWDHIWLNEGLRDPSPRLWFESTLAGTTATTCIGPRQLRRRHRHDHAAARCIQPAMVGRGTTSRGGRRPSGEERQAIPEGRKRAAALRRRLGDRRSFRAVAVYVDPSKGRTAGRTTSARSQGEVSGEV